MNFKILQVNGQDLSGASQEDATAAFTRAEEPITVVVRRATTSSNCQQPGQSWTTTTTTTHPTPHQSPTTAGVCASTQTSEKHQHQQTSEVQATTNKLCLCQHLMQLCAVNPTSVFSTIILNELIRLRNESMSCPPQQPPTIVTKPPSLVTTTTPTATQRHTENTNTDHMEVVLNRTSQRQKLGIVLRDHKRRSDGTIYVYISDIVKGSIADKCERLQSGDRVLSINGQSVASMSQAAMVLQQQSSIIVLVVARKTPPSSLDKQSTTIIGTTTTSSDHVTCKSPSPTTNHKVNSINQCLPPPSPLLPAATAPPQVGQQQATTGKSLNRQEPAPKIASSCDTKGSGCNQVAEGGSKSPSTGDLRCNSYDEDTALINGGDPPHSLAHEFTFVEPKDYDRPIKPVRFIGGGGGVPNPPPLSSPSPINEAGAVSPGGKMTSEHHHHHDVIDTADYGQLSELAKLVTAIEHLEMEQLDDEAYEDDVADDAAAAAGEEQGLDLVDSPFVVSPWVKIARQDYEDVMRAEKQINHRSSHHVVKPSNKTNRYHPRNHAITNSNGQAGEPTGKRTSSVGTDSTSSAYSTGESMRSSSTASGTTSSTQSSSTTSSAGAGGRSCKSANHNVTTPDHEHDGCYLTHDDDYNSEDDVTTKEDASAAVLPVATATTVAGVDNHRHHHHHHRRHHHHHHNELYKSSSASVSAESVAAATTTATANGATVEDPQHGRQHADKGHKSEWKVKIRRDGTRYITKRPTTATRRDRQSTSSNNDLVATDDDPVGVGEVEGQSCSRATRQHQQQSGQQQQQQRKRRRKQRSSGRLESLQENTSSSSSSKDKLASSSTEMSRHKVARRKRMLLGSFATVQEILAHGRANPSELAEVNPLLSVTYI